MEQSHVSHQLVQRGQVALSQLVRPGLWRTLDRLHDGHAVQRLSCQLWHDLLNLTLQCFYVLPWSLAWLQTTLVQPLKDLTLHHLRRQEMQHLFFGSTDCSIPFSSLYLRLNPVGHPGRPPTRAEGIADQVQGHHARQVFQARITPKLLEETPWFGVLEHGEGQAQCPSRPGTRVHRVIHHRSRITQIIRPVSVHSVCLHHHTGRRHDTPDRWRRPRNSPEASCDVTSD